MLPSRVKSPAPGKPQCRAQSAVTPRNPGAATERPWTGPLPPRRLPVERSARSSEALVVACSTGDGAALGALFARFQAPVSRFLSRRLGPGHPDREDLVQATFLQVMRAAPRFRQDASVQTWILGIAFNIARHHRRREARRQLLANDVQSHAELLHPGQKCLATRTEQVASLLPALRALADDLRTVFMMCELEEIPGAEVARILKLSEGTLWRRREAARKLLRQALSEESAELVELG